MKTTTISLAIGLLFLIFCPVAEAQILQTRSEVIETYGTPFSSGISKSGDPYLFYKIPVTTKNSGSYDQGRVIFFKTDEKGVETCYKWKIIEPQSETYYNITSFSRDLVQIGELQWKDHGKGIVYQIEEKNGVCKITAWYDNTVDLAKVYKM